MTRLMYPKGSKEYKAMSKFLEAKRKGINDIDAQMQYLGEEYSKVITDFFYEHTRGKVACFMNQVTEAEK